MQLSLLVFKCILKVPLRPGDVRQLDPDFWTHRVRPILEPQGATERQRQLESWGAAPNAWHFALVPGMDALTFTSADGLRESAASTKKKRDDLRLKPEGSKVRVTEENKEAAAHMIHIAT